MESNPRGKYLKENQKKFCRKSMGTGPKLGRTIRIKQVANIGTERQKMIWNENQMNNFKNNIR